MIRQSLDALADHYVLGSTEKLTTRVAIWVRTVRYNPLGIIP
jgi:hypothetical protein